MSTIADLLYRVRLLEKEQDGHVFFDPTLGKLQYIRGGKPEDFDLSELQLASLGDVDVETTPPQIGQVLGYGIVIGSADAVWRPVDLGYVHTQSPASDTWTITHRLGIRPGGVLSIDDTGARIVGDITFSDANTLVMTFGSPREGTAYVS